MKLKIKQDLEQILDFIYRTYVLEDDNNLDDGAKELKEHYRYVIKDLELHDCLEIVKGEK